MDKEDYVEEIKEADFNRDIKEDVLLGKEDHRTDRGIVGSLLCAASMTRPDISFDVAGIAGATNAPKVTDMKRAAKVIKRAKRSKVVLRFPRMEGEVQLIVYCDAAWGNLDSGKSGGSIFLALATTNPKGGNEQFCPVNWHAKRLRRVVRSTFALKTLIASEAMDEVIYTAEIWSELGNNPVRTTLGTD